ncbi:MAG TPA: HEAT repeat domain-containing protein [Planctomycetota bacterium]|nr:HEAT repeat domain-containing protein [Planctomycetota bacterium]
MGLSLLLSCLALLGADQETEDALKAFDKGYRNPDAHARAGAVLELARTQNIAIMSKLAEFLTADEAPVRIAAAKGLGDFKENKPKAAGVLMSALGVDAKEFDVVAAILTALGTLGDPSGLSTIHQHFSSKEPKDAEHLVPKSAILAAGLARSRDSLEPLMELLKEELKATGTTGNDKSTKNTGGGVRGIPGGGTNPQKDRAKALIPSVIKALQAITREKWATAKEWEIWWEHHKDNFVVPK